MRCTRLTGVDQRVVVVHMRLRAKVPRTILVDVDLLRQDSPGCKSRFEEGLSSPRSAHPTEQGTR